MWFRALTVSLLYFTLITPAYAQLAVNKSILEVTNQVGRTSVRLTNNGADTLYINLNLHEVLDPATSDTNTKLLSDPTQDGILVHPRQLVLQPGQSRSARVVLSRRVEQQDRVFRLNLEPMVGDALVAQTDKREAGVKMLLGYKLLVLARPDELQPDVKMQREKHKVVFENNGNTSVLLRKLSVCESENSACTDLAPNRLYPNEILTVAMPAGMNGNSASIRTRQSVNTSENQVVYNP